MAPFSDLKFVFHNTFFIMMLDHGKSTCYQPTRYAKQIYTYLVGGSLLLYKIHWYVKVTYNDMALLLNSFSMVHYSSKRLPPICSCSCPFFGANLYFYSVWLLYMTSISLIASSANIYSKKMTTKKQSLLFGNRT